MKLIKRNSKVFIILFALIILYSVTIFEVTAPTGAIKKDDTWIYQKLANGDYQILGYQVEKAHMKIPKRYDGKRVHMVDGQAFQKMSELTKLEVNKEIVYFGVGLFKETTKLNQIIVPINTSSDFIKKLSLYTMTTTPKNVVMYEKNHMKYYVDEKQVNQYELQSNSYFIEKKQGESAVFSIEVFQHPTYIWDGNSWKKQDNMEDIYHAEDDVEWYIETVSKEESKIESGKDLVLEDIKIEDAGLYIVKVKGEVVFQVQLDVRTLNNHLYSINTKDETSKLKAIYILLGAVVISITYYKIKRHELTKGW